MKRKTALMLAALLAPLAGVSAQQGTGGPVPGGPSGVEVGTDGSTTGSGQRQGDGSKEQGASTRYEVGASTETSRDSATGGVKERDGGSRRGRLWRGTRYDRREVPQPGITPPEERPR